MCLRFPLFRKKRKKSLSGGRRRGPSCRFDWDIGDVAPDSGTAAQLLPHSAQSRHLDAFWSLDKGFDRVFVTAGDPRLRYGKRTKTLTVAGGGPSVCVPPLLAPSFFFFSLTFTIVVFISFFFLFFMCGLFFITFFDAPGT